MLETIEFMLLSCRSYNTDTNSQMNKEEACCLKLKFRDLEALLRPYIRATYVLKNSNIVER